MRRLQPPELIGLLADAEPDEQRRIINSMTTPDLLDNDADFEGFAHRAQLPPGTPGWRTWLMMAGRGFGKTRAGAEWIEKIARSRPGMRIALVGASLDEARRVMVEGVSGVLSVARRRRHKVKWEPSIGRLSWPNGSSAQIFSGDSPDGLRGPEHDIAWFLTFEVEADPQVVALGDLLREVSHDVIRCCASGEIAGFASYGDSVAAAVRPLIESYAIDLFDDGELLRSPSATSAQVRPQQPGCSVDGDTAPVSERSQIAARALPSAVTVGYYDAARDYQAGQMRASLAGGGMKRALQLPAVLGAEAAKGLAEKALARAWAQRETMTLRLPPAYLGLEPGALLLPPGEGEYWSAARVTLEGLTVRVMLRPATDEGRAVAADSGRANKAADEPMQPTLLRVLELPDLATGIADAPVVVLVAASGGTPRFVPVEVEVGSAAKVLHSVRRGTIMGESVTVLGDGQSSVIDRAAIVDVQLANADAWLQSCDDDLLIAGHNLALLGDELIQFGSAIPLGAGAFRLSRLLRGRRGTEWAIASHQVGEPFTMLDAAMLEQVRLQASDVGATISAIPRGLADDAALPVQRELSGEAMRPLSPVHLSAATDAAGNLSCRWVRRSRRGWGWIDGVDAPLDHASERYRVRIAGALDALDVDTNAPTVTFSAAEIAELGAGIMLSVSQIGDFAISRPASLAIE